MVDADVHSTLTGLHYCCHSPQRKQMGCQFPTGNAMILGKQVLGGQGCKPALPICGPYCWREMLLLFSSVINIILSPEAAKAHLVGGGDVRQAWHSSLWHLSNESQLHCLEVCWMAEHYLLIETKIQKMRPTNQFSPEIIATSFNLHLQKLSVKLISGFCQCQHTYDTHFCHKLPRASLHFPTLAWNMATGTISGL